MRLEEISDKAVRCSGVMSGKLTDVNIIGVGKTKQIVKLTIEIDNQPNLPGVEDED